MIKYHTKNINKQFVSQTVIHTLANVGIKDLSGWLKKWDIHVVVKRLRLKYKKWRVMNSIRQLDFDMQCTNMTYKQYEIDYKRLSEQYDNLK